MLALEHVPVDGPLLCNLSRCICQVENLVVSSGGTSGAVHISAPICSAVCRIRVSSIRRIATHPRLVDGCATCFDWCLVDFHQRFQWAARSVSISCFLHLFGVMFTLLGLCSFGVSQPVGRSRRLFES